MRRKLLSGASLAVVCTAVWLFWPRGGYVVSRVDPKVRQLQQPYQSVWTSIYLDGGSIAIKIVDRNGRKVEAVFPVNIDSPRPPRYDRLFIGSVSPSDTNSVEVVHPEDTKWMLVDIVDRYAPTGLDRDVTLISLRGAPMDYSRAYLRRAFQK
jgi:hypothetical protein